MPKFLPEIQQWGGPSLYSGLRLSSRVERRRIKTPSLALAWSILTFSWIPRRRQEGRKEESTEGRKEGIEEAGDFITSIISKCFIKSYRKASQWNLAGLFGSSESSGLQGLRQKVRMAKRPRHEKEEQMWTSRQHYDQESIMTSPYQVLQFSSFCITILFHHIYLIMRCHQLYS